MASIGRRSVSAALVACSPPLARIHERLFSALQIDPPTGGECGKPGGGDVRPSEYASVVNPVTGRVGPSNEEITRFGLDYFSSQWLSKLDDGKSSDAKAAAALSKFALAESVCAELNQRSERQWRDSPYQQEILLARKIASRILGPFDWNDAARCFGWGPGASVRLTRREADAAYKYCGTPQTTIGNAVLANAAILHFPLWASSLPDLPEDEGVGKCHIVPGNRVVTVPKNYKTDRVIAIEPDMNTYIQQGIGKHIRTRLSLFGCDLQDQTRNQRMALVGSVAGTLATVDLSMASDTISRAIVERIVRSDWLEALGQSRSPFGVLPSGEKIFYQKFSSMGNSYTFELETVIFYSLALACCMTQNEETSRVCVYGDDIVIPVGAVDRFFGLLQFAGFKPNEQKSYWTGSFRESCGKHYFAGHDVTPFYVKKAPKSLIDLFKIHNQIFRFEKRCGSWLGPDRIESLRSVRTWLRSYAPAKWRRPTLLDGIGDGGFVGEFDEVLPNRCSRGWDGYWCHSMLSVPIPDESFDAVGILTKSVALLERRAGEQALGYLTGQEESAVYPIKGTRWRKAKVFIGQRLIGGQYTTSSTEKDNE